MYPGPSKEDDMNYKKAKCKKCILWKVQPHGFLETGKFAFILKHRGDDLNTGYSNSLQNLLRIAYISIINICNWVASLSVLSSQNSIVPHRSWFFALHPTTFYRSSVYNALHYIFVTQGGVFSHRGSLGRKHRETYGERREKWVETKGSITDSRRKKGKESPPFSVFFLLSRNINL